MWALTSMRLTVHYWSTYPLFLLSILFRVATITRCIFNCLFLVISSRPVLRIPIDRSVSPAWFVWHFDAVVRSQHATSLIYSLSCYFLFASRVCIICICASNYPMLIRLNLHSSSPHLVFLLTARYIILFVSTHSKVYHSILPVCRVFVSLIDS